MGDRIFRSLAAIAAVAVLAAAASVLWTLARAAGPAFAQFGLPFLASSAWDPVRRLFGALPLLYGTAYTSLVAMTVATPVGLAAALFLSEVSPPRLRGTLGFLAEFLATVPSVIFGLWGIFVLVPWLRDRVESPVQSLLGWIPVFGGPAYGTGILAAGLILAIMVLPTITTIAFEVFRSVPGSQREAAYALGVTRWEMIRTVLWPAARAGVVGALVLALGRALGETMAVTMVIGNAHGISASLFAPGNTMSSVIANQFAEATDTLQLSALVEIGLLLFLVTLGVNVGARWIAGRVGAVHA